MALSYDESATLMNDVAFRGRIKVAALEYATYILGEAPDATAHNSRYKWAQGTFQSPEMIALQIHPGVVMDDAVQANGAAIIDSDLKGAVQRVVNRII